MPEVFNSEIDQKKPETVELPAPKGGIFSSFLCQPSWVTFDSKDKNEKIVLLMRQHMIVNVPWILLALVMILSPWVLMSFPILSFLPVKFQLMGVLFWYLLTTAFIFERFLGWFYNIYIVTDKRIVDIDFVNLTYKQVDECRFGDIESLTYSHGGFIRALFNFGTVMVQTAAEIVNIEFEDVPNPSEVTKVISSLKPEGGSE